MAEPAWVPAVVSDLLEEPLGVWQREMEQLLRESLFRLWPLEHLMFLAVLPEILRIVAFPTICHSWQDISLVTHRFREDISAPQRPAQTENPQMWICTMPHSLRSHRARIRWLQPLMEVSGINGKRRRPRRLLQHA